jgi:transcriptional regulator
MHPNAAFRSDDHALLEALLTEIAFGMVFLTTPDGPRVGHVPLAYTGQGAVQFHLARGNALTKHLPGATALVVVNGPDGYISPRWYADNTQVPTWNYVALELEGRVRQIDEDGLRAQLAHIAGQHEARITTGGQPWTLDKTPPDKVKAMLRAIVGFELDVQAWRPTLKLSQNKGDAERLRVADALDQQGNAALAGLMRELIR